MRYKQQIAQAGYPSFCSALSDMHAAVTGMLCIDTPNQYSMSGHSQGGICVAAHLHDRTGCMRMLTFMPRCPAGIRRILRWWAVRQVVQGNPLG